MAQAFDRRARATALFDGLFAELFGGLFGRFGAGELRVQRGETLFQADDLSPQFRQAGKDRRRLAPRIGTGSLVGRSAPSGSGSAKDR